MSTNRRRMAVTANPFFTLLLIVSVGFVITALAYTASPAIAGRPDSGPGSIALARWLDRNGPLTLGIEIAVMIVVGSVAMATDRWFTQRAERE